jgi:hypothetical protein
MILALKKGYAALAVERLVVASSAGADIVDAISLRNGG